MAVGIKNICDYSEKIRNVSHILTEVLGTTTSYIFLEDTLRPYVKKNLKEYVLNHWNDDELVEIVKALKAQAELETKEGWVGAIAIPEGDDVDATKEAVISYALCQMVGNNIDSLSQLIEKDGYSTEQLKGHVFPDVLPAFKKWTEEGKKIYFYSSGKELSQQSLMANSVDGDITKLISGCFESSEFPSDKSESFREICKKLDCPADKVTFLTHNVATACAAHKAGLMVIMLSREGNSYIGNYSFPVITSFDDISKQICGKRKKAPDAVESTEGKRAKLDEPVSEKEAEPEKPEEKDAESLPETKPAGEANAETVVDVGSEVKTGAEEEEKMEVDGEEEETKGEEEKAEEGMEVKIVVTPPGEDGSVTVEKVSEDVNGAPKKVEETVEVAKVDEVEKDKQEEKAEAAAEKVDAAEKEEKESERKEEDSKLEAEVKKEVTEDGKTEAEVEKKSTKEDTSALEVKADEGTGGEGEKVDEKPTEEEKSKENGVSEAKMVENGEAGDGAGSGKEGLEEKEVNGNGVAHVNGGDGVAGEKVTESAEKIVAKKVEKDEAKVEVTTDTAKESA